MRGGRRRRRASRRRGAFRRWRARGRLAPPSQGRQAAEARPPLGEVQPLGGGRLQPHEDGRGALDAHRGDRPERGGGGGRLRHRQHRRAGRVAPGRLAPCAGRGRGRGGGARAGAVDASAGGGEDGDVLDAAGSAVRPLALHLLLHLLRGHLRAGARLLVHDGSGAGGRPWRELRRHWQGLLQRWRALPPLPARPRSGRCEADGADPCVARGGRPRRPLQRRGALCLAVVAARCGVHTRVAALRLDHRARREVVRGLLVLLFRLRLVEQ
mmetsp:Transcript_130628/g.377838  ORF Transcript_130628/g.377838 Transcript_130628/m.377838 type:complete len:269 (+) Transcript_130628:781-1587(+)